MSKVQHLLLTLFNVRRKAWKADKKRRPILTDEWMEHRMGLFEKFSLPSVRNQSNQEFQWLVFFDAHGTSWDQRERIRAHMEYPNLKPVFILDSPVMADWVRPWVSPDTEFLITTRLDHDDALHRDALKTVRAQFREQAFEFVNLRRGLILANGKLSIIAEGSNPFISLIEKKAQRPFTTVWCGEHLNLGRKGPIRQGPGGPHWLRTVHERNLSNTRRGARCAYTPERLKEEFGITVE